MMFSTGLIGELVIRTYFESQNRRIYAVREILTSNGRSIAQGALGWLWARSQKTLPIPGFRTVEQVKENAGAMQYGPLTTQQMNEIDTILERAR